MDNDTKFIDEYVNINGIQQYFLHFPSSPEKEVLLFLHGGPGTSESVTAYTMQSYHEKQFHVVYYDQRGAGKTYLKNPDSIADADNLLKDLEEVVEYLKKKYHKEKIIILGHSWGTILGTVYVQKHPENVLQYIGVSQVVNMNENEKARCVYLMNLLRSKGKHGALTFLDDINESTKGTFDKNMLTKKQIRKLRNLQIRNKMLKGASFSMLKIMRKSPIYEKQDLKIMMTAKARSTKLWEYIYTYDLKKIFHYEWPVPALFISGDEDFQVPYSLVQDYAEEMKKQQSGNKVQGVKAQPVEYEIFKGAGHFVMYDDSKKFWDSIDTFVKSTK